MPVKVTQPRVQMKWGRFTLMFKWGILKWYAIGLVYKWVKRRIRRAFHHPIPLAVLGVAIFMLSISPMLLFLTLAVLYPALGWWMWSHPTAYEQQVNQRLRGWYYSWFRYRREWRHNLKACGLIDDNDATPERLKVLAGPVVHKMLIRMPAGMMMDDWLKQAPRLAPALEVQDCKARPVYKRNGERHPRKVELELLNRNPFRLPVSVDYIDHYLDEKNPLPIEGNPTGPLRNGNPCRIPRGRHVLFIGATGSGKSGGMRAHVYSNRLAIESGLLQLWGADGKKGVEVSYMEHMFSRTCYGDGLNPERFYAEAFAEFFEDAVREMMRRLDRMRGSTTIHTATPDEPDIQIWVDELLVFKSEFIPPAVQKRIFSSMALIQRLGRAPGISLMGCAQDPRMDDLPGRRGYTDTKVYWVKGRAEVDMAMGPHAYDRGARAPEIRRDQQGTAFLESEGGMAPEETRDAMVTDEDIRGLRGTPVQEAPIHADLPGQLDGDWRGTLIPGEVVEPEPVEPEGPRELVGASSQQGATSRRRLGLNAARKQRKGRR